MQSVVRVMPVSRIRLDRDLTLGLVQPFRRLIGDRFRRRIPVLMYHGVNSGSRSLHPYFETNTSPATFARQMQQLCDLGYKTLDISSAVNLISSANNEEKAVVITFDDGFRDFYTQAMPILQYHKLSATMFVVANFMGSRQECFAGKEFMTWSETREIESLGITIGSHTVNHPRLNDLHPREVEAELKESKRNIENKLGKAITTFSYPYAFPEQDFTFTEQIRTYLVNAGYSYGVTTVLGSVNRASDPYFLPRIPVNEHDDDKLFQAKLEGFYDWLHTPQFFYKFARNFRRPQRTPENQESTSRFVAKL